MKIAVAQTRSEKGDITKNIEKHLRFTTFAIENGAALIVFPELSLTSYEPELAEALATTASDERLDVLQQASNVNGIIICAGLPTRHEEGNRISMVIFSPNEPRQVYSKQMLHSDELPYFTHGQGQLALNIGNSRIAPAICYESLQPEHATTVAKEGITVYMASVAKSANGVAKAFAHYPQIAKLHNMAVVMSNSIGPSDNFVGSGQSSAWTADGTLAGQLDADSEGILLFDTATGRTEAYYI